MPNDYLEIPLFLVTAYPLLMVKYYDTAVAFQELFLLLELLCFLGIQIQFSSIQKLGLESKSMKL